MGDLSAVPFHVLPWRGDVLIAAKPVAYGLDLGLAHTDVSKSAARQQALVVADPTHHGATTGRLLAAQNEGALVAQYLERDGLTVTQLVGDDTTKSAVVAELARAQWFHYAGHGSADGRAGWQSALPLAGESRLDVADVLALAPAPAVVVLSGCETGRSKLEDQPAGMHMAAAFLLSGARFVIASDDEIADSDAIAFARAFYEPNPHGPDPWDRFRDAMLTLRSRRPAGSTWQTLRAWTP